MSINLDNLAQAGQAGGRTDRRHPGARQDRWLLELEQAMFAQARNKPAQRHAADTGGQSGTAPVQAAAMAAPETQLTVTGVAAPAQRAVVDAPPGAAPGGAIASEARAPASQDIGVEQAPVTPHGDVAPAFAQDTGAWHGAQAPTQAALAAVSKASAAGALAGLAAATYARLAGQPDGAEGATTVRQAERVAGGAAGWLAAPGAELAPGQELPPVPAEAQADEPAPQGAPAAASDEEYSPRNMHLHRDGREVQAWLRDSTVRPEQALGLAQAVAAALAGEGAQLRTLTLNGKPVPLREERAGKEQDGFADSLAASGYAYNVKGAN